VLYGLKTFHLRPLQSPVLWGTFHYFLSLLKEFFSWIFFFCIDCSKHSQQAGISLCALQPERTGCTRAARFWGRDGHSNSQSSSSGVSNPPLGAGSHRG